MRPVILIVLDGWGVAPAGPGNAISQAKLPFYNSLLNSYPHGLLKASGVAVGLPQGEDGNTETGHINLGAGYIVYQDLPRINLSIADGTFFQNQAFLSAINHARKYESKIHLLGLVGSGGVHSNLEHLLALLQLMKEQGFIRVFLHLITDGRDSPPKSASIYISQIQIYLGSLGFGEIASIMGRYYAMDRDLRWDRTEKAYKVLTAGAGDCATTVNQAILNNYNKKITDEFIEPTSITKKGKPIGLIEENDSVIFFNFRIDRPRQLTKAFVLDDFRNNSNISDFDPYAVKYHKKHLVDIPNYQKPFERGDKISHLYFVTMTEYSQLVKVSAVAFPPNIVSHPMGETISQMGLHQLRISESEKERFVTYYFNGLREAPFLGEDRLIVPSPKVSTYDLKPEMSSQELTDQVIKNLNLNKYNFILINFANPDMVAHTGNLAATIKACESTDVCLAKIIPKVLDHNGTVFITADHGNAEELIDLKTGEIDTEHSTFPVPFIAINKKWEGKSVELPTGVLADIAPTILDLMQIKKPAEMGSRNLLSNIID
ncbi:2,3-bisphosphoglycerate-independent phosphoglycerate mutase [Candidatus Gottesmanbacteria bacterium]|nr:2,3-bisphosphoglycerate-independent phosphoglycerate mutase [Candidatus Gottesmanbacteria bacterium]